MVDGNEQPVLEIRGLRTRFETPAGDLDAVDGVTLSLERGDTLCLVGESGSGKSVTSLSVMGLVPPPGRVVSGEVLLDGQNLLELSEKELREVRGSDISMIFQQPSTALNPSYRVEMQIREVFKLHRNWSRDVEKAKVIEALEKVGMPDPQARARAFPHELSGGMAQRVMIAMALACEPQVLIADEPTTALDVTIQAQILDLITELKEESGTSVLLITHDLGVVAEMADQVAVMYAGEIVETTDVNSLFDDPKHPYTRGLIGSVPVLGSPQEELHAIPGRVPSMLDLGQGCRFAPRCEARQKAGLEICNSERPDLLPVSDGHMVRCWLYQVPNGKQQDDE